MTLAPQPLADDVEARIEQDDQLDRAELHLRVNSITIVVPIELGATITVYAPARGIELQLIRAEVDDEAHARGEQCKWATFRVKVNGQSSAPVRVTG